MNKTLLIVADLGLLRAYRETKNVADRPPHLELVEELKLESAHQKLSDQLSDQAGRFPRGGGAANISGNLSAGESLNSEAEQTRRLISQLAGRINALLGDNEVTRCSIAISGAIHNQLLEAID
ncbi:MAG: host attachment protein, partial [bacterium]|nr:host attachment protein [bacterium]